MFMDAKGRVIYVGKAKNLRNRLSSYFNAGVKTIKTEKMLTHASNVKTIITENEVEAFLLEANLIKTEMPKYNILLKDSKGYPYVKLTQEEYPRRGPHGAEPTIRQGTAPHIPFRPPRSLIFSFYPCCQSILLPLYLTIPLYSLHTAS